MYYILYTVNVLMYNTIYYPPYIIIYHHLIHHLYIIGFFVYNVVIYSCYTQIL